MIEICDGIKKYGSKIVLKDINYKFEDGKIHGITGANGSGKTLILNTIPKGQLLRFFLNWMKNTSFFL